MTELSMEGSPVMLALNGIHPYYPQLGMVSVMAEVVDQPPGPVLRNFRETTGTEWAPLTSDFLLVGLAQESERAALLAMLWDLLGRPMHPKHHKRRVCSFALVAGGKNRVSIWRPAREMLNSASVRTVSLRENLPSLPDGRERGGSMSSVNGVDYRIAMVDRLLSVLYGKLAGADDAALVDLMTRIDGALDERLRLEAEVCKAGWRMPVSLESVCALHQRAALEAVEESARAADDKVRAAFLGTLEAEDRLRRELFVSVARDACKAGFEAQADALQTEFERMSRRLAELESLRDSEVQVLRN